MFVATTNNQHTNAALLESRVRRVRDVCPDARLQLCQGLDQRFLITWDQLTIDMHHWLRRIRLHQRGMLTSCTFSWSMVPLLTLLVITGRSQYGWHQGRGRLKTCCPRAKSVGHSACRQHVDRHADSHTYIQQTEDRFLRSLGKTNFFFFF